MYIHKLTDFIQLCRPKQWLKGVFVFFPLLFSGQFVSLHAIMDTCLAFASFCLAASAIYIINDIKDIEVDRYHPEKSKKRPLAAGKITLPQALAAFTLLIFINIFLISLIPTITWVILTYFFLNILYTFKLKNIVLFELFIVSSGFVLRVCAGSEALSVKFSRWMLITSAFMALYLITVKRLKELLNSEGTPARLVIRQYTEPFLRQLAHMSQTCVVVFYSLFSVFERPEMMISLLFVIYGVTRYNFLSETSSLGESPTEAIASDRHMVLNGLIWILSIILASSSEELRSIIQ